MTPTTTLNVVKNFVDSTGTAHFSTVWWRYGKCVGQLQVQLEWVTGMPSFFRGSYSLDAPEPPRPPQSAPASVAGGVPMR